MIDVRIFGPFRMCTDAGQDVTPGSVKTRALVALLLTGAGGSRARRWLQDKLWSTRGAEQAAGSLRQALFELRRALGAEAGLLVTDRTTVTLDLAQVRVLPPEGTGQEFLEGIDVGDSEFEEWLSVERLARDAQETRATARIGPAVIATSRPAPITVLLRGPDGVDGPVGPVLDLVADAFVGTLTDAALAEVRLEAHGAGEEDAELLLDLAYHPAANILRARLVCIGSGRHVWTGTLRLDTLGPDPRMRTEIARFATDGAQAAIADGLRRPRETTPGEEAIVRAVRKIFSFTPADLAEAERLLVGVAEVHPSALGWRVFLRMVHRVENAVRADPDVVAEVEALVQESLRRGPRDPIVLAAAAHACIKVLDRPGDAVILAQKALQISWFNPFAIDALSDALLLRNRVDESLELAAMAQRIGQATPMSHFFDMGLCLSSVACGRYEDALSMATQAAALAPSFRPALRYGALLSGALGVQDDAERALARLRSVEPDFALDRMLNDPDYPVPTFRACPIARAGPLRELR
jgi:tetratricopeptide (TPR) repeat protein